MRTRDAVVEDAPGIARVHVESWRAAYAGLMPQAVLDDLSVGASAERAVGFYVRNGWMANDALKVDERPGLVLRERRHVKRLADA